MSRVPGGMVVGEGELEAREESGCGGHGEGRGRGKREELSVGGLKMRRWNCWKEEESKEESQLWKGRRREREGKEC